MATDDGNYDDASDDDDDTDVADDNNNDNDDANNEWQNVGKIQDSDCTMHETRLCLMVTPMTKMMMMMTILP